MPQLDNDIGRQDRVMSQIYDLLAAPDVRSLTEMIEEKKRELGLSQRYLSQVLGITRPSLDRITNGEAKKIDVLTILKLDQFLGLGVEETLKVFVSQMTPSDIAELERTRDNSFLVSRFNLEKLKEIGLISSLRDLGEVRERITSFFGLETIRDYDTQMSWGLFSRARQSIGDKMLEFWVKSAYRQFERIKNPNLFDKETLKELVPQIRQYSRYENQGLLTVARALFKSGITVIVQDYLPRTTVRGGTFVVDGKPCIALTNRNNLYPTIWFTLLHELGHVVFHWDKLQTLKFHVSGSEDLFLVEEEANYFAQELLFPNEHLNYIKTFIDAPGVVSKYAEKCNVHPSLIYAFYAYEQHKNGDKTAFRNYQKYMPRADKAIYALRTHPWDKETLDEAADRAREILNVSEGG